MNSVQEQNKHAFLSFEHQRQRLEAREHGYKIPVVKHERRDILETEHGQLSSCDQSLGMN
jgi:hypothetical protein